MAEIKMQKPAFGSRTTELPKFVIPLELWRIDGKPQFIKLISTGEFEYHDLPCDIRDEWTLPNDWHDKPTRQILNECLLAAAKPQFGNIARDLEWSEGAFGKTVQLEMTRRRVDITETLNRSRVQGKGLYFSNIVNNRYVFCHLLDYLRKSAPNFFNEWSSRTLNSEQTKTFGAIYKKLKHNMNYNLAVSWGSSLDQFHALLKSGHFYTSDINSNQNRVLEIKQLSKSNFFSGREIFQHTIQLYNKSDDTMVFTGLDARLEFSKTTPDIREQLLYGREKILEEHKLSIKLARTIRHDHVTIKAKSVQNILLGLERLTNAFTEHHSNIIIEDRWDPGLNIKGKRFDEYEISDFLIQSNAVEAIPLLESFVRAVMGLQIKLHRERSLSMKKETTLIWSLWHTNDEGLVGSPSITALIRLSQTVGPLLLQFFRHRDIDHDVYTHEALSDKILPYLSIETPGSLELISMIALQTLATGNIKEDIFASHGMDKIKAALISNKINTDTVAATLIFEVKALEGNLSWANSNGPEGLIALAANGLNRTEVWQEKLALSLLQQYPEAKQFLAG